MAAESRGKMSSDQGEQPIELVRTAFTKRAPAATGEFRLRAWRTFQAALERHLAGRKSLTKRRAGS